MSLSGAVARAEEGARERLFARVFGDAAKLDPAMVAKAKAAKHGEYVLVDTNGDGKHDEAWFIDVSPRHTKAVQPLLVRAIDRDGDLDKDGHPDLDSDLYIADSHADGSVDAVVEYIDTDHDNDVDEMAMYYWSPKDHYLGKDALRCWWSRDDGDDNQLWYDVNYAYDQTMCQWRTNFSGEETFVAFGLTEDSSQWQSIWENPFLFFDRDRDGCSDEVMRISGIGDEVEALRWSFDADDDAHGRNAHDYDFSVTAIAPGSRFTRGDNHAGSDLKIPASMRKGLVLRGIPTQSWLQREHAREFARSAPWARAMLSWDEINANTDPEVARDPHERWEGVIAQGNPDFPQVGGPGCGRFNKRFELVEHPRAPLRLYFSPADHRLHLFGAKRGWLDVDFNFDGKLDARYEWSDEDDDGYFDRRSLDSDGDGRIDFSWPMGPDGRKDVALEEDQIAPLWKAELQQTLDESQALIDAERAIIALVNRQARPALVRCPSLDFFSDQLAKWMPQARLGERIRATLAGAAFYTGLVRDQLLITAWPNWAEHAAAREIYPMLAAGKNRDAAQMMLKEWVASGPQIDPRAFRSFTRRIPIRIDNRGGPRRDAWPVVLSRAALLNAAPEFNLDQCAVVAPDRRIDWLEIPHQIDTLDAVAGPELTFLADVPPDSQLTWYLYDAPSGPTPTKYPARTASAEDWVPPNIGWESERIAYRTYYGQFDFFGKKVNQLIYPAIGKTSYHSETEWGIDALNSSTTSGVGGVTLYLNGTAYPAMNPVNKGNVKITKQQVSAGPVRCAVRVDMSNIIPGQPSLTLHLIAIIYAGHQESVIRATITGAKNEVLLAPGLMKLKPSERAFGDAKAGCFGTWGFQTSGIGEIGLAVIGPPDRYVETADLPDERRYLWRAPDRHLSWWIVADWQHGRQYPVAPTAANWDHETHQLASQLLTNVRTQLLSAEQIGN